MGTDQAATVQAAAAIVSAFLTFVLSILTTIYVLLTRELAKTTLAQSNGSAHERLYNQNQSLLEVLACHPEARPYFYANKSLEDTSTAVERNLMLMIAEMYAGLLEQVAIHLPNLPSSVNLQWRMFIQDAYHLSPAIQNYFEEFGRWYSPELLKMLPVIKTSRTLKT